MPLILGANSVSGGYEIDNSLRFNSGSSDNLTKTFSTSGTSDKIKTFSFWLKRATSSTEVVIISAGSSTRDFIRFESTGELRVRLSGGSADLITTQLFRDVSAWYHIVIAFDTPQATSSNRIKIYVNGSQVTALGTATYPSQNATIKLGTNNPNHIGNDSEQTNPYFDGYMTEFYLIDGQALTPSSFGETDQDTNIWKPIPYTGSFGTNGFYLEFQNSGALGTDSSGNGNNFTVNNLTSIDQTTDTPTNNFATMNPLDQTAITSVTNGNLTITTNGTVSSNIRGTFAVSSGKWYWEVKCVSFSTAGTWMIGVADITTLISSSTWASANAWSYYGANGDKYNSGSSLAYGATYTTNDIISVLLDMDNGTLIFYKNGVSQGTAFSTGLTGKLITPVIGSGLYSVVADFNFGNPPYSANSYTDGAGYGNFSYAVPSGYYSLNTKNLANFG